MTIVEILKDNLALSQSKDLVDQGRAELAGELLALLNRPVPIDLGADVDPIDIDPDV